jgi:hypothetical protein
MVSGFLPKTVSNTKTKNLMPTPIISKSRIQNSVSHGKTHQTALLCAHMSTQALLLVKSNNKIIQNFRTLATTLAS